MIKVYPESLGCSLWPFVLLGDVSSPSSGLGRDLGSVMLGVSIASMSGYLGFVPGAFARWRLAGAWPSPWGRLRQPVVLAGGR